MDEISELFMESKRKQRKKKKRGKKKKRSKGTGLSFSGHRSFHLPICGGRVRLRELVLVLWKWE